MLNKFLKVALIFIPIDLLLLLLLMFFTFILEIVFTPSSLFFLWVVPLMFCAGLVAVFSKIISKKVAISYAVTVVIGALVFILLGKLLIFPLLGM